MATSSFYLKVISANRVFFAGKCRSLIVPEFDGQKEILAHHEDMVIAIDEGQMKFQPEGSDEWIHAVVGMGFVEIVNNRVTLLVETAEKPEEIDVRRAEEAKQRAEERLSMSIITQEQHLQELWQDLRQHLESKIYVIHMWVCTCQNACEKRSDRCFFVVQG